MPLLTSSPLKLESSSIVKLQKLFHSYNMDHSFKCCCLSITTKTYLSSIFLHLFSLITMGFSFVKSAQTVHRGVSLEPVSD